MNKSMLTAMARLISECGTVHYNRQRIHIKAKKILKGKSSRAMIQQLKMDLEKVDRKKRPGIVFLVVWILLCRCLQEKESIAQALQEENMISLLYGGMRILLCGDSPSMRLRITWSDHQFSNRCEFLERFSEYYYYDYIEIFYCGEIIQQANPRYFETLVMKDKSKLFLLNIYAGYISFEPPKHMLDALLQGEDILAHNIAFSFFIRPLLKVMRQYKEYDGKASAGRGLSRSRLNREVMDLSSEIVDFLKQAELSVQVDLLVNFILLHDRVPKKFQEWLFRPKVRSSLLQEITTGEKICNLKKVKHILSLVYSTRLKGGIEKSNLYEAIFCVLKKIIVERKIYSWGNREEQEFSIICQCFPQRQKNKLRSFCEQQCRGLLVSPLDRYIRFLLFLRDQQQYEILKGMISVLSSGK